MFKFLLISGLLFFLGYGIVSFFVKNFGGGNRKAQSSQQRTKRYNPPQEEKKFTKDIGEYVSYEEVKDDEENKK